jgi:hypothetical protein
MLLHVLGACDDTVRRLDSTTTVSSSDSDRLACSTPPPRKTLFRRSQDLRPSWKTGTRGVRNDLLADLNGRDQKWTGLGIAIAS